MDNFYKISKLDLLVWLISALVVSYLVISWLPGNQIIGGGDVGIPTYLPNRAFELVKTTWWETQDTGTTNPVTLTAVPFYGGLSSLELVGINHFMTQKLFIWLVLFGGVLAIYYWMKLVSNDRRIWLLASGYYLFNFVTLNVWHRGVHNAMLFLLLAPMSVALLNYGLKTKSYSSILGINILCFLMSYVFGSPVYVFVLWLLWFGLLVNQFFSTSDRKFVLRYGVFLMVSWVICNYWWLGYFLESSKYVFGRFNEEELRQRSSDIVLALKEQTQLSEIFRGVSRFYLYDVKHWGEFYGSVAGILLSWLPVLIIFSTSLYKRNYRSAIWRTCFSLVLVVIFISKGVNAPFGWLNKAAYDSFSFLAPLRNPYEKVGIILTLPSAYLFGLGVVLLGQKIKQRTLAGVVAATLLVLCLGTLVWPMWSGRVFGSQDHNPKITIPAYYQVVDDWLAEQTNNSRILHLPLSPGESVDYDWGYSGVEPNQLFFKGSSIGYTVGLPTVDNRIFDLIELVHQQDTTNLAKALKSLDIGWVVLHKETLWKNRGHESPDRIEQFLSNHPELFSLTKTEGPLKIYQINLANQPVVVVNQLTYLQSLTDGITPVWPKISSESAGFVVDSRIDNLPTKVINHLDQMVIFPSRVLEYEAATRVYPENALAELPYVRQLPSSWWYGLVQLKESINQLTSINPPISDCLDLAGKRLVEAVLLAKNSQFEQASNNLEVYRRQLNSCNNLESASFGSYLNSSQRRIDTLERLTRQRFVLEREFNDSSIKTAVEQTRIWLAEYMSEIGIAPQFLPADQTEKVIVYSFEVPEGGVYRLNFDLIDQKFAAINPRIVKINGQSQQIAIQPGSFTEVKLDQGWQEIHLVADQVGVELMPNQLKISGDYGVMIDPESGQDYYQFKAGKEVGEIKLSLNQISPDQQYQIEFDYDTVLGAPPEVRLIEDAGRLGVGGQVVPVIDHQILFDRYVQHWRQQLYYYTPSRNATQAEVSIKIKPWQSCQDYFGLEPKIDDQPCRNVERESVVRIKNIKLVNVFKPRLYLESTGSADLRLGSAQVVAVKESPTEYRLNLSDQRPPYLIKFNQTAHQAWAVWTTDNQPIDLTPVTIDGYSNGWLVENELPDQVVIKFGLQEMVGRGVVVSVIGYIGLLLVVIWRDKRHGNKD